MAIMWYLIIYGNLFILIFNHIELKTIGLSILVFGLGVGIGGIIGEFHQK